jgi:UDP-3-O-[3-hydroxymyristoyl] glucosamine N-acyltransferase
VSEHLYTLAELADILAVSCQGDPNRQISGMATLASATAGQLSFLANSKYEQALRTTSASVVIVAPDMVAACPADCLISDNPYLTYAKASQLFADHSAYSSGIHPTAFVSASATVADSANIGANASIADGAVIAANCTIGPGCAIGKGSVIGEDSLLHANVSVYHDVVIGCRAIIHSSAVIGGDGFGFAPSDNREQGGWIKIAQLGGVRIGDDVEIGAGTTIDRGALDNTIIGDRVILDNMVMIGHNVELGDNVAMAACSGVSGSTRVGRNCTISGGAGIIGHAVMVDNVHITAMTMVTKSILEPGSYSSGTSMQESSVWRRNAVRFSQLDSINKRLKKLEKISAHGDNNDDGH